MSMIQVEAESVSGNEDVLTKQRRIATSPKNAILSSVEDVLYGSVCRSAILYCCNILLT